METTEQICTSLIVTGFLLLVASAVVVVTLPSLCISTTNAPALITRDMLPMIYGVIGIIDAYLVAGIVVGLTTDIDE